MKSKLQQMSKFALPALLVALMAGCATTSDLEKVQKQVDEVRMSASNANANANSAMATAQDARAIASEARNTSDKALAAAAAAEKFASEASGFSAAAVKSSEAAVGVAVQAQNSVNQATVAIPWMRLDPATGRFNVQWVVWPSVGEYTGAPQAPAAAAQAPADAAPAPAANGK